MASRLGSSVRGERGVALVVTILLLLLVSGVGIMALNRAGDEKLVAGASRRQLMNVSAAEAGLRMIQSQLQVSARNGVEPPPFPLNLTAVATDKSNRDTMVFSGSMSSSGPVIAPIQRLTRNCKLENNDVREGGGKINRCIPYRVDVIATDPGGGSTHLQAQFKVIVAGGGGYN